VQRLSASDDAFLSVPMNTAYARRAIKEKKLHVAKPKIAAPTRPAPTAALRSKQAADLRSKLAAAMRRKMAAAALNRPLPAYVAPVALGFTSYRDSRIGIYAIDPSKRWLYRGKVGIAGRMSRLDQHRGEVLISSSLSEWAGLKPGDKIRIRTVKGMRSLKIADTVNDISWPLGSVYMNISQYRYLFGRYTVNQYAVQNGHIDQSKIKDLRPLHTFSGGVLIKRIRHQIDATRKNILAMRLLVVIAALVAISGIFATSVFARRREWGVLRAMGMKSRRLFLALGIEILLILLIGSIAGMIVGVATYEGPILSFMSSQGFPLGSEIVIGPILATAGAAILAGVLAVLIPAILVTRIRLTDALSYE